MNDDDKKEVKNMITFAILEERLQQKIENRRKEMYQMNDRMNVLMGVILGGVFVSFIGITWMVLT